MTTKTYAQLGTFSSVSGTFLVAGWDPAGPGPLKTGTASVWRTYFQANLGTASLKDTGTSGNTVALLDGANTWSAAQTFSNGITGTLAGSASAVAAGAVGTAGLASGAVTTAKLSTGAPVWDTSGNLVVGGTQLQVSSSIFLRDVSGTTFLDFSLASGNKLTYNNGTGVLTLWTGNVAVFSIDAFGNVIAKGSITPNGTPQT